MKLLPLAAVLTIAASGANAQNAAAGDPTAGEKVFNTRKACHAVGEGAGNRVGPHLNDVFGRVPGSLEDYRYSSAMVELGKRRVWDPATLAAYIASPRQVVPGTKMTFAGVKDGKRMADLLAYIAQFDPQGTEVQEGVPSPSSQ